LASLTIFAVLCEIEKSTKITVHYNKKLTTRQFVLP